MLSSLARFKGLLGPEADIFADDELIMLLKAASNAIERHCMRSFKRQEYTEYLNGHQNSPYLNLRNYPVHKVLLVKSEDSVIDDGYKCFENGRLYRADGWPQGCHNIEVTYVGGYVLPSDETSENPRTLPEDIEIACILYAQILSRNHGVKSERVGDISVTYDDSGNDLPASVQALIHPYVRYA